MDRTGLADHTFYQHDPRYIDDDGRQSKYVCGEFGGFGCGKPMRELPWRYGVHVLQCRNLACHRDHQNQKYINNNRLALRW